MTMPHMMNCAHSPDGWCLECVRNLGNENAKMKEALFGKSGISSGVAVIEKNLAIAEKADPSDVPFPLMGNDATLWHRATAEAYRHALEMLSPEENGLTKHPGGNVTLINIPRRRDSGENCVY